MTTRVLSVGAGAVGGTIAARLARHKIDVTVLDTNAEHVALLRDPGLIVGGLDDGTPQRLDATTATDGLGRQDLVLLSVRSQATNAALASIADILGDETDVLSLQNGLNEDRIAELVGAGRTIGCVVGIGATWIEPGRIELNANGDLTIGRLDGTTDVRLERARDLLHNAFPVKVSSNIRGDLWGKMLVNSMTVLGALGGMLTGDVLVTPDRRRIVADVVAEGIRVARSEDVRVPDVFGLVPAGLVDNERWHEVMQRVLVRVGEAFGAIKSVTWRDFELGRVTEIDAVTGEIVRRGERNGVPVPLSASVYAMLREIEGGKRKPDAANLDGLIARTG